MISSTTDIVDFNVSDLAEATENADMLPPVDNANDSNHVYSGGSKRLCFICKKMRNKLSDHMMRAHGWQAPNARAVFSTFKLRKTRVDKGLTKAERTIPKKDYHRAKICPMENCHKVLTAQMKRHLNTVHTIGNNTERMNDLLAKSKYFCETTNILHLCSAPRRLCSGWQRIRRVAETHKKSCEETRITDNKQKTSSFLETWISHINFGN